ncbi:MAG: SusD/RagB family nutrient-binding outer membrane lipoprotein [Tannerellaceae bacterium]|nr:SusD/RagB family nutrient-binding outer membrane lipoprotein [Tannerellaceae bacterium]
MKRNIYKIIASVTLVTIFFFTGCTSSFDELNTNPDAPTAVTPGMLATNLILSHLKSSNSDNSELFSKRLFWGEQIDNYQYNRISKGSFSSIRALTNAQKMVELAPEIDQDVYTGLYYYMKAWAFYRTTMEMGDIPYTQALDVDTYTYPVYDEQKEVFRGILNDLQLADQYFGATDRTISGDPFYKGNPVLWRKATNVLRLKVLMSLQKRAEDTPNLKVKETFAQIVSEGNLFEGNQDNLQIIYTEKDGQMNPWHQDYTKSINVYGATHTILDPLKAYKDYRLFYYFEPAQALTDPLYLPEGTTLLPPNDWNAYPGVDAAGFFTTEQTKISSRMHTRLNNIYRLSYVGVPSIRLGYADMNFILAEAAERGWITGPAKEYYEKGIRASFEFVRSTVPADEQYTHGMDITDSYIDEYLQGEYTAYKQGGTQQERLQQIWMQAYLASFFHLAWDSYFEYRRTGYPELPVNPETNLNDEKDKIPVRWMYPDRENNYNKEELEAALQRQWGGVEDVNRVMWLIK